MTAFIHENRKSPVVQGEKKESHVHEEL